MSKDPQVRIHDTIAFIRNAMVPAHNMAQRDTVADMLQDRDNAGTFPHNVSQMMSQGSNLAIFNRTAIQELRHYRRAIILIRMALENAHATVAPFETAQIADANLPAELGNRIGRVDATRQDLAAQLATIKTRPINFLSNNNVQISGAGPTAGVVRYVLVHDEGNDEYRLAPSLPPENLVTLDVDVFHLPVTSYANLARSGQTITVPGQVVAGADLMVTTQLTGCSVVYWCGPAGLVAAHIQPVGTVAETMCTDLRSKARLGGAPQGAVTGVFGAQHARGVDPNNYIKTNMWNYCLGVDIGGAWGLYAQQRPGRLAPGATSAWRII